MAVDSDYDAIYNYFKNKNFGDFESKGRNGNTYYRVKSHTAEELEKQVNSQYINKPYFETNYNRRRTWGDEGNNEKDYKTIKEIIAKSDLNDKYNIKVWNDERKNEVIIIHKNAPILNSEQLEEIEKAKEYGLKKYNYLLPLVGMGDHVNKYNI
jgi:hypothetical protein